ncbi:MAG: sugar phosphate nucleotidyltransferase, partial [Candidatus Aenigmatarchaeota archaeon]
MKAIILAAGKGERLEPLTDYKPKCLLPICNKPLLDYQIELLKKYGIDEIAVVVGYLENEIRKRYSELKFYKDEMMMGTASALLAARNFIDDDFVLMYGDIFYDGSLEEIVKNKNSMGIFYVEDVSRFGKVVFENKKLVEIREKSSIGKGFINAGIYHFDPSIIEFAEKTEKSPRGEFELTDSILMMNKVKQINVVELRGYWKDIGYPWDYLDVNMYVLEKIKFSVGEGTEIWKSAIIRKPVVIGENCEIKNAVIEKSIVGNNCVVGEFSVLKRSILMNNSRVPHLNYVADSIIAENVNLGAGTIIANLRFDERNIKFTINKKRVDSGKRKFGAIIGYNVKTAINVSIYPGV